MITDEELHRHHAANLERADALLFGRVTYEMMEAVWRRPATGTWPDWMADWMIPFARTIDGAKKYVVSGTLDQVDWAPVCCARHFSFDDRLVTPDRTSRRWGRGSSSGD
jgi:hypothetical protein